MFVVTEAEAAAPGAVMKCQIDRWGQIVCRVRSFAVFVLCLSSVSK